MEGKPMEVIAHRGDSGTYPENTMLAFRKAAAAGCDGIELDIQLTKDGVMVVIHDETIDRVTDGAGRVVDYTAAELRHFNVAATWDGQHGFCGIPTFEEYCEWASGQGIMTNIELKTGGYYYEGIEERAAAMVRHYGLGRRVFFSSFNHVSLIRMKQLAPEIPCGALMPDATFGNAGYYCRKYGFEFYHPGMKGLTEHVVRECRDQGIEVNVWGVDGIDELGQMAAWGCHGIFTNDPNICKSWLALQKSLEKLK